MRSYTKVTLFSSWGGVLFTGIILGSRVFVGNWIMNEPYPYFLWFPSWWVCFTLFSLIFAVTAAADKEKVEFGLAAAANIAIAFLGSLLSGRYIIDVVLNQQLSEAKMQFIVLFPWSLYVFCLFGTMFVMSSAYLIFKKVKN